MENLKVFNKKIIGIDCFEGIPENYGHPNCPDKLFNDTTYDLCLSNINKNNNYFPGNSNNYLILKSYYRDTNKIISFFNENNIKKCCFVHLDCDVVKSCEEALNIMLDNDLLTDTFFIQFDDWGIRTGIPDWFSSFSKTSMNVYNILPLYETRLTKTFLISKNT
jgi:hypothetical protein